MQFGTLVGLQRVYGFQSHITPSHNCSYTITIIVHKGSVDMPRFSPNGPNSGGPMPMGPPPSVTPQRSAQARAGTQRVSPGSIRNCIGRFTYVWLSNGHEFWLFPVQVWGDSVAGFRWDRRFGWSYTGISLRRIDMFTCSW